MADLEAALEQYRINDEIVQGIVNDEALDSSLVLLDSLWESGDHAVAVTSTDMLRSLAYFLKNLPDGIVLYTDCQNKIVRGKHRMLWMGASRISSESSRIYEHALQQLNTLIERISGKRKNIQNTILAFLHDAAPGANAAAQKILGRGVTNAATPGFFDLLAAALVTEATDENGEPTRASKYLANTLNRGRHGSPCVAMETPKMRGTQVLTNIIESWHRAVFHNFNQERLNISKFAADLPKVFQVLKTNHRGNFVESPDNLDNFDYHVSMKASGTRIYMDRHFMEVTEDVNRIKGESQESTRYFVFASHEKTGSPTKLERSEVTRYLRGLLIADYGEDPQSLTVDQIVESFFQYHMSAVAGERAAWCSCKSGRDWGCCRHTFASELAIGSRTKYIPENQKFQKLRRGPATRKKVGALGRYDSVVEAPSQTPRQTDSRGSSIDGSSVSRAGTEEGQREDNDHESTNEISEEWGGWKDDNCHGSANRISEERREWEDESGHESTHEISEEWEEWEDESANPQSTNKISEEWEEWEDRSRKSANEVPEEWEEWVDENGHKSANGISEEWEEWVDKSGHESANEVSEEWEEWEDKSNKSSHDSSEEWGDKSNEATHYISAEWEERRDESGS
ncbi:hypothetical protein Pmar_PMAR021376 [Perkinsus marinus ATCC 50983]|uniref:SWIM-type domain-containing protein n=1 Tax=Perkinsus marinus (strain ATCC 50983 / TXsc) TaxID=423536 RepID=C5KX45_PERM5|nr:hypothetical protein Pmar_PMAR021376 [Perkinsus marinus ATCC 50983]EER10901.1 hypothetical protein Pmar_PMAR021376 [Perkinsus marinus ATCC 50983]|eukprot:XP_002779106.1 hypothetical protein Pmar_PMAR021376 [Perkinsus marinus ATCC 50983]